ncbi:type II secretion system protein [uncultured Clostridium sp.]|jgi:prepilin-type N-terminal cleavage/methylation domain-containing protein|uniref:type II secretion system protein n=1 Tax=uncultured Clostridium sp. TaxID=59620 RepID=UPI00260C52F5|nr:prepilin-type N-terminal cleavage/methylation domain-containing protein [uncultured Clostridium sp.]
MLKNKLKNKKKGFTLIELIVVLAVLAIIALIAIPNFNQIRENSKISSDKRGADLIDKAVTMLVQDGSISGKVTDDAATETEDIKSGLYGYKSDGKLGLVEVGSTAEAIMFTTDEIKKIEKTINDGKGPQGNDKKAIWEIVATGLGTKSPDVKVLLFEDNTITTVGAEIYDSNSAEVK